MRNLRTNLIFFISYPAISFAQVPKQENTVLLFGILPFSLFLISLILSLIYLNKDKTDDKRLLGIFSWTASIFNSFYGLAWTYNFFNGIYTAIIGAPIFSNFTLIFLLAFMIGGFLPIYYMYKADIRPRFKKKF